MEERTVDSLTDIQYWDRIWTNRAIPDPLNPNQKSLKGRVPRSFHRFFQGIFESIGIKSGDLLLEAGCGGSVLLPYFREQFGLVAEGLDNSEEGCNLSQAIAKKSGIPTQIFFGDVLNPPELMLERYRVVVSMGLVEHFRPTTAILNTLRNLVQPSGSMITVVPNMHGVLGLLQRLIDPEIYGIHVPLSPQELADAHRACGLEVLEASHLMTANFGALNFSGPGSRIPARFGLRVTSWLSKAIWAVEGIGLPTMPNGVTSPYVFVVARKAARDPKISN